MAVKLASAFNTSPQFWLNAQQALDIYKVYKHIRTVPEPIAKTS
jgi:plasmid maintenance system antidote protein VapI